MGELTLLILRIAFLVVLWGFIFAIVYALRSDLFGQKVRRLPAPAAQTAAPAAPVAQHPTAPAPATEQLSRQQPAASGGPGSLEARRLVITSGAKAGLEMDLPPEAMTIGRSNESGLVIRDDYTSTHHARLLLWADGWVIQDLDSTNGTFLNGTRVLVPTHVPLNTPVKIGTTSFELRR
ncbi:FHA domain-containing protein [Salinibacterium sp. G-O1]|uniref:FHA domain-containing protein FhaB/FipA n=1 Tax=Salinibacterium sp. G-O1 TaxID=3046208 RepID=UPI0024BA5AB9|nr:FHA domain-containing protein [Salinibacterium sp. G-O1]MDJ0333664.1 FHA domain-containing protein [Salinibacterium sp. G-O1]